MSERVSYLQSRMTERDVVPDEVREYCWLVHKPMFDQLGGTPPDLNVFVTPEALVAYWWLVDWWKPAFDIPLHLRTPTLEALTLNYTTLNGYTILEAVQRFHADCVRFAKDAGIEPEYLQESEADRKDRVNKERMKKVRAGRRVPDKKIPDAVAPQVRALEEERARVRREAVAEDAELRARVRELQAGMIAAAETRKQAKIDADAAIDRLTNEITALVTAAKTTVAE